MLAHRNIVNVIPHDLIHYYHDIYFTLNNDIKLTTSQPGFMGFDSGWRTIEFDSASTELISYLLPYLDGTHSLRDLSQRLVFAEQDLLNILQSLYEIGFLTTSTKAPIPALSFYNHLTSVARLYRAKTQSNNLEEERKDDNQETSKNHLIGKLTSLCFLFSSAEKHLSDAKAHIKNKELRYKLSHYLSTEYWCSHMLESALPHLGYSPSQIDKLKPIPSVAAMINYLQCLARTDALAYAACLSLMEFPSTSAKYISILIAEWSKIEALGLIPCEAIEPFKQYQLMRFTNQHGAISKEFFRYALPLPSERQEEIKEAVFTFIEYQLEASKGIKEHFDH